MPKATQLEFEPSEPYAEPAQCSAAQAEEQRSGRVKEVSRVLGSTSQAE